MIHVTIRFDPNSLELKETEMLFHIFANTTSKLVGPDLPERDVLVHVVRRAELIVRGWVNPEQSFYSGASTLQDSPMELKDVGSPLVHTYSIFNEGPSAAPKVQLIIYLPLMLENGHGKDLEQGKEQYLQYLEEKPSIETGQGECTVAPEYVNPLKLTSKMAANQRSAPYMIAPAAMKKSPMHRQLQLNKTLSFNQAQSQSQTQHWSQQKSSLEQGGANRLPRSTFERIVRPERFMDGRDSSVKSKKQQIVELNCDKFTAHCIKIQCEFYAMPAKTEAQVTLKARLWNSTLVAEYPRVDLVRIISTAMVKIPKDFHVEQLENNDSILVCSRQSSEGDFKLSLIFQFVLGGDARLSGTARSTAGALPAVDHCVGRAGWAAAACRLYVWNVEVRLLQEKAANRSDTQRQSGEDERGEALPGGQEQS